MTYAFWSPQSHSCDTGDMLQTKLADSLASLLLVTAVNSDGGTGRNGGLALASTLLVLRVGRVRSLLGGGLLGGLVVGELLNTGVRHLARGFGRCRETVEE